MALFEGEELVDVPFPDGSTRKLPRSLVPASMMPQVAQAPAGFTDETSYNIGPTPNEPVPGAFTSEEHGTVTPAQQQAASQEALTAMGTPVVSALGTTADALGGGATQTARAVDGFVENAPTTDQLKQQQKQAAYKATPQGKLDSAQAQSNAADANAQEAIYGQADVAAAEQATVADAMTERNKKLDERFAQRAADMQAQVELEDKKMNEIVGLRKKIAGTKIDRKADHPILAGIMAALAGLGSAMKGEKVDTLDILYKAIDRKVAAQEADLDQMGKTYGMTKDELAMLKERGKSKLEFHNALIAAETDKAIRQVEELTARSASEKTKADAKVIIAQLQQRAADKTMEATRWGLDFDQKEKHQAQQIGLGYAGLKEQRYSTNLNAQLRREEIAADLQKALASDRARGDTEMFKARLEADKEARQTGIRDMNGEFYLTPAGKAKLAEAQQLEGQAKQLESNPDAMARSVASDKIALMRQKAAILRGDANSMDVVKAHSDTEAVTVSNMISSGQSVVQLIDGIKELSDQAGRGLISRDAAQVKLKAMFNQLKPGLKEAWQLGAWDKGAAGLVEQIIGADPTSDWNAGTLGSIVGKKMYEDSKAFKQGLDSVAEDLERKAKNKLVGLGTKFGQGDTVLHRSAAQEISPSAVKLSQERSGTELSKDAEQAGTVGKTARAIGYPFSPSHAQEAENAQSTKYLGLSKDQEAPFEERLTAYKSGDKKAGDELIQTIADAAQKRPDLAIPLLQQLRTQAPNLYTAARSAIPAGSEADKQMTYEDNNRVGASMVPTNMLASTVLQSVDKDGKITDDDGLKELGRRAGKKDREAQKALADIFNRKVANQSLPQGSVFREGR